MASLSTFTRRVIIQNIKEILIDIIVLKILLISLGGLTNMVIQIALINHLIVLLNGQILKILLYEQELQSELVRLLAPWGHHLLSVAA